MPDAVVIFSTFTMLLFLFSATDDWCVKKQRKLNILN